MPPSVEPITELVAAARQGDRHAADRLYSSVYDELRRLGKRQRLRLGASETLNTTSVVHEAFLRLTAASRLDIADRGHFWAVTARAMRAVIVDAARRRLARKRGGDLAIDPISDDVLAEHPERSPEEILAVEDAMGRLENLDPRLAKVVELRFWAGLSEPEAAEVLGMSDRTLRRDWRRARAFLLAELAPGQPAPLS
jgi:RNA polymerase sigma factor (TIGR02999 family)